MPSRSLTRSSAVGDVTDREALTDELYRDGNLGPGYMYRNDCEHLAGCFLASDWLADRDARIRREVLDEAIEAIIKGAPSLNAELRHDGTSEPTMAAYIEGFHDAHQAVANLRDGADT